MKKVYDQVQPYKFRLTVLLLLCGASLFSIILFRLRTVLSDSLDYAFLVWNLFLAWIPLGLAYAATVFSWRRYYLLLSLPIATILWLLFFPNAPYLLTDLQHLGNLKPGIPVWFDVLLLIWFSWTGLLLGMVSLFLMQDIVRREFGRIAGWTFVISVGFLSSLGIYIGRFLRWNSWDIILNPLSRFKEFSSLAIHPSLQSILFISVFGTFFILFYSTIYAFGLLLNEQAHPVHKEIT